MEAATRLRLTGLWRHPDFLKLWAGQTISVFGSQVTGLALPLTAAVLLNASPEQMGILTALASVPWLLFGLLAGVWVDRLPRRRMMLATDLGRGLLLLAVPLAALSQTLRIELLYVVEFLVGVLTVFFNVAYPSYLPSLVQRAQLVEGNSKLEATTSLAQVAGPALAGVLIRVFTAPIAILLDALSFLVSGLFLGWIRAPETMPTHTGAAPSVLREIGEGLRLLFRNPILRALAGSAATFNLFGGLSGAVFILYLTRELGLEAGILGIIFGLGSVGSLLGALVGGRLTGRFGLGPTILGSTALSVVGSLLFLLARGPFALVVAVLIAAQFVTGLSVLIFNVNVVSLRQAVTPDRLLGRVNASVRFLAFGSLPIGSLIGGALGGRIGLYPTLVIGALGTFFAVAWVFFSPVRGLREPPAPPEEAASAHVTDEVEVL